MMTMMLMIMNNYYTYIRTSREAFSHLPPFLYQTLWGLSLGLTDTTNSIGRHFRSTRKKSPVDDPTGTSLPTCACVKNTSHSKCILSDYNGKHWMATQQNRPLPCMHSCYYYILAKILNERHVQTWIDHTSVKNLMILPSTVPWSMCSTDTKSCG